MILQRLVPFLGLAILVGLCLAMSTNRMAAIKRWQLFVWGFGLQFGFGFLVLNTEIGKVVFKMLNDAFVAILDSTQAGTRFVFGSLADPGGASGFVFAFFVLTTIIFFSALTAILYHLGILQKVVTGLAWVMTKTMRTSGAETLSASANIFVGQTEAPLVVRPYIGKMTNSELMTVMTGGFATVAGGVLAAYVGMLKDQIPDIAGHLMAASIMSAPAALLFGKLMVPETETPETLDKLDIHVDQGTTNVLDAAAYGTSEGVRLAINVGGMLIAFLALIAMVDLILVGSASQFMAEVPSWLNLRSIVGYLFAPLAWTMGVTDWAEAVQVGQLLGIKMVANEFVAYGDLSQMAELSTRSKIIASYALCGFANFGSIGIQIGGLAVMAENRRHDLSRLAFRAMLAGTFAANATACVAAILIPIQ